MEILMNHVCVGVWCVGGGAACTSVSLRSVAELAHLILAAFRNSSARRSAGFNYKPLNMHSSLVYWHNSKQGVSASNGAMRTNFQESA